MRMKHELSKEELEVLKHKLDYITIEERNRILKSVEDEYGPGLSEYKVKI